MSTPQTEKDPNAALNAMLKIVHDKWPLVPPKVVTNVPRVSKDLLEKFKKIYVPDIADAVGACYTMDEGIRPFYEPIRKLVGQALTVKAPPCDNMTIHGALGLVEPGDVMIIDWRGYTGACGSGAGALTIPISKGLAGLIIDGAWRDAEELQQLDFPMFTRGINMYSPVRRRVGEINVAVSCGGVVVHPGDIIVADREGICVVPLEHAERVANGLKPYEPKTALEEWTPGRDAGALAKAKAYQAFIEERGGKYVPFSKNGS